MAFILKYKYILKFKLGDGSLYKSSNTSNTRFEMSFGSQYKEFALYIGNIFANYMSNPIKSVDIKLKNKSYINFRLKTRSLPMFNYYYDLFYEYDCNLGKFKKIVAKNMIDFMDRIVLAFLIMSYGNFLATLYLK
jgi:hypothetical protein